MTESVTHVERWHRTLATQLAQISKRKRQIMLRTSISHYELKQLRADALQRRERCSRRDIEAQHFRGKDRDFASRFQYRLSSCSLRSGCGGGGGVDLEPILHSNKPERVSAASVAWGQAAAPRHHHPHLPVFQGGGSAAAQPQNSSQPLQGRYRHYSFRALRNCLVPLPASWLTPRKRTSTSTSTSTSAGCSSARCVRCLPYPRELPKILIPPPLPSAPNRPLSDYLAPIRHPDAAATAGFHPPAPSPSPSPLSLPLPAPPACCQLRRSPAVNTLTYQ